MKTRKEQQNMRSLNHGGDYALTLVLAHAGAGPGSVLLHRGDHEHMNGWDARSMTPA